MIDESILFELDKLNGNQEEYFTQLYLNKISNLKIKLKLSLKQKIIALIFRKYMKKAMEGTILKSFEESIRKRKPVEEAENDLERLLIIKSNELDGIPLENKKLYLKLLNLSKVINSNVILFKENPSFDLAKDLFRNHIVFLNSKIEMNKIIIKKGKIQKELKKIHLAYNRSKKIPLNQILIDLIQDLNSKTPGWKTGVNLGKNMALENEPKKFEKLTLTEQMINVNSEKIKKDKKELLEILYISIKQDDKKRQN